MVTRHKRPAGLFSAARAEFASTAPMQVPLTRCKSVRDNGGRSHRVLTGDGSRACHCGQMSHEQHANVPPDDDAAAWCHGNCHEAVACGLFLCCQGCLGSGPCHHRPKFCC